MARVNSTETAESRWNWLYKLSGAAALIVGVLFLIPVLDLIIPGFQPGTANGWLSLFQDNWLVVIFKLHAGFRGVQSNQLYNLNFLDIAIMALVGVVYLGLYAALRRAGKIWSIIALAQPFLGIALFMATKSAGRSGVMGAGLVISIIMLRGNIFNKVTAYMGLLSSALLLFGDISEGITHSYVIAILTGVGYVLLIVWFFLIAKSLFQHGQGVQFHIMRQIQ